MKTISIEFGQVTWIVDVTIPAGRIYLPEALAKIQERYKFFLVPSVEKLVSTADANVTFEHGKFGDSVIRKFSMHPDGFVASSLAGTEVVESFYQDFMEWMGDEYGFRVLGLKETFKAFDSHLVVQMDIDLEEKLLAFKFVADVIGQCFKDYDLNTTDYLPSGINLANDQGDGPSIITSSFALERRRGQPFAHNLYFSAAPLKTGDHQRLLEKIEKTI